VKPHPVTHEQAAAVFGFLCEFGKRYPTLCEGDRTLYRDLCRAAIIAIREQEWEEEAALGSAVERVMDQTARVQAQAEIGRHVLARLRREHRISRVRWDGRELRGSPVRHVTDQARELVHRYEHEIKAALAEEAIPA
jgi:ribosomal protein S19E (S16A)